MYAPLSWIRRGTITKGEFRVQSVSPFGGRTEEELLGIAARCEMSSTHPIAASIVSAARERGLDPERPQSVEEISGKGIRAVLDGVQVLCGGRALYGGISD